MRQQSRLVEFQIFCFIWFFWITAAQAAAPERLIMAQEAYALSQTGQMTIIDVRRPSEWRETGLAKGAKPISLHSALFMLRSNFVDDVLAAVDGDRDTTIALICAGGVRSAKAFEILSEAGFTDLRDIGEGMMGDGRNTGWLPRGLPRTMCPDC